MASIGRDVSILQGQRYWWVQVMARLAPGVSLEQAEVAASVVFDGNIAAEWGDIREGEPGVVPVLELTAGGQGLGEIRQAM